MNTQYTVGEIIYTLIGRVFPTGRHEVDMERVRTVKEYDYIIRVLVMDLMGNVEYKDNVEYSMKAIGEQSYESLKQIRDLINDVMEEGEG